MTRDFSRHLRAYGFANAEVLQLVRSPMKVFIGGYQVVPLILRVRPCDKNVALLITPPAVYLAYYWWERRVGEKK